MNVLMYGNTTDKELLVQHMKSQACLFFRRVNIIQTEEYDEFAELLQEKKFDMVFVTMDNAAGMEGVIMVQNLNPRTPIVWFSNDKNFVAQSYRLGVKYFAVKPISEKIWKLAIEKCRRDKNIT